MRHSPGVSSVTSPDWNEPFTPLGWFLAPHHLGDSEQHHPSRMRTGRGSEEVARDPEPMPKPKPSQKGHTSNITVADQAGCHRASLFGWPQPHSLFKHQPTRRVVSRYSRVLATASSSVLQPAAPKEKATRPSETTVSHASTKGTGAGTLRRTSSDLRLIFACGTGNWCGPQMGTAPGGDQPLRDQCPWCGRRHTRISTESSAQKCRR